MIPPWRRNRSEQTAAYDRHQRAKQRMSPGLRQAVQRFTQHVAAQQGVLVKVEHDPRVTGVGRVLRATSLDELPQLFNILKGQMSFVGPRPLIAFMLQPCPEFARARSLVRPGITGLWQVRERHNNTSAFSMKAHDLEYVQQFSLRLDMAILFKTARVVVSRQGAC